MVQDKHSLGFIHSILGHTLISVGGMAQGEEWSRLRHSLGFIHFVQGAL
jgi:hypothetical protein